MVVIRNPFVVSKTGTPKKYCAQNYIFYWDNQKPFINMFPSFDKILTDSV
jgi:hypothetical protein